MSLRAAASNRIILSLNLIFGIRRFLLGNWDFVFSLHLLIYAKRRSTFKLILNINAQFNQEKPKNDRKANRKFRFFMRL